jgi:hypothetical protein
VSRRVAPGLLAVAFLGAPALPARAEPPVGWHFYEPVGGEYETGIDRRVAHSGSASGRLASRVARPTGYGLMVQIVSAARWRRKRVRLSAQVRTERVSAWAGMFLRVDGPDRDPKRPLVYDTMQQRPLRGTTGWRRVTVVLDVPEIASQLVYGSLVNGPGTMWIDDVRLEEVDLSVPTTNVDQPEHPRNTGFEE